MRLHAAGHTNACASLAFVGLGGVVLLEGAMSDPVFSGDGYAARPDLRATLHYSRPLRYGCRALDLYQRDYRHASTILGRPAICAYDLAADYRFELTQAVSWV